VADGPEESPADLRVTGGKPNLRSLARDHEVQLALNTLKLHDATPAASSPRPLRRRRHPRRN